MTTLASGIILYRREGDAATHAVPLSAPPAPHPAPHAAQAASVRLLLLRNADNGHWGFAKGRRDRSDAHEIETALREVREETGYQGLELHPGFRSVLEYTVRQRGGAPYAKRVVYFLAQAPDAEPTLSREHDAALWADDATVESRLSYGQLRDLARGVFALLRNG